eukprot:GHVO01044994.1.p1 GENE.GHVO01044994.1~~GHVO01044994.1.p1  ORF type:complete len:364 (-),score=73.18 GHVO01044994.1:361-1452(-)
MSKTSAEELLFVGRNQLSTQQYEEAIQSFSDALEILQLANDDELHPMFRKYYLALGDALLQKEENVGDYLKLQPKDSEQNDGAENACAEDSVGPNAHASVDGGAPSLPPAELDDKAEEGDMVNDEQLAWENLEMARLTYERYLDSVDPEAVTAEERTDILAEVRDASFVHVRLGDMLIVSEQFDNAAGEYQLALDMREKYGLPYTTMTSSLICLGQAKLFGLRPVEALVAFEKALQYVEDEMASRDDNGMSKDQLESFRLTAEDLRIQIEEIKVNITKGLYEKLLKDSAQAAAKETASSGSADMPQQEAKLKVLTAYDAEPPKTTSTFDAPTLTDGKLLDLGVHSTSARKRKFESCERTLESD